MNSYDDQREIEGRPRTVDEMNDELRLTVKDASQFIIGMMDAFSTRNCLWPGQSSDGRKHSDAMGEEPFPWEGASDARIRLADEIINDHVIIKTNALLRADIKAVPVESQDMRQAGAVSAFMKWLFGNKMNKSARTEGRLISNWEESYGHAVMAVTWDQEVSYEKRTITIDDLKMAGQQMAQPKPNQSPQLAQQQQQMARQWQDMLLAVFDPAREDEAKQWLMMIDPEMTRRKVAGALKSLRDDGSFDTVTKKVTKSQPCWTACRPYRDVWYPANTTNIENARWIAFRECLTPAELRLRIATDEYDQNVVEDAISKNLSQTVMEDIVFSTNTMDRRKILTDEMEGLVEIFCFYERVSDDNGGIEVQKTIFAPGLEGALWEGDSPYADNEYPVVPFVRFQTERLLIENQGVPEKCDTQQQEIKVQRDYRVDRSSITIMPPIEVPQNRQNMKLEFGPGRKVPVRKRGEVGAMDMGKMEPDTVLIEQQTMASVDSYFARWKEGVHPARQALYSQLMVDDYLGSWSQIARKTLALCRHYWTDELFARVTGVKMPFAIKDPSEADDFEYDITLRFNAADLDMETVYRKLDVIAKAILPADTMGAINRVPILKWAMQAIDYSLAEQSVKSEKDASFAEIDDEQVQIAKISAGVEPPNKGKGQNAALRMKVLQESIQKNPELQQRYADQNGVFRKLVDNRLKGFQFQLQQQENAQIGRVGTGQVLGGNGNGVGA